jgi:hypothetical protein
MGDLKRKNFNTGFVLIDLSTPDKISVQSRGTLQPGGSELPKAKGEKLRI